MNLLDDGYVVDVPYPTFVHRQAMPVWLKTVAHLKGVVTPDLSRPYRYLELGCAMGIHLHLTAAANPIGHFVGVDFNAEHLAVADEGLKTTGIDNIEFIHASFAELLEKEQEPFDFIVTHGVWSWISDENQKIVVDIINKLLKPNGILYISYMSHPGATGLTSVQKLMFEMSRNLQGDSAQKASQSLALVRHLGQTNVGVFAKIPELNQELEVLAKDKPSYIAHDFLSQHWQPQHSADMIRLFGNIQLSYLAGAGIMENMDMLTLPPEVRKILKTLPLVTLQETVKDMARYSLQRQDIYIREKTRLDTDNLTELYDSIQFGLLPHAPVRQDLSNDPKIGMIRDVIPIFEGILRCLEQQKNSILGLHQQFKLKISLTQFSDVVLVLVWAGYIHPLRFDALPAKAEQVTNQWMYAQRLNWRCNGSFGSFVDLSKL